VFALARETGWSRDFILWELELTEALQYNHAALRSSGCWTVEPMTDGKTQVERLEAYVAHEIDDEDEE
jgi:hypothetical protein